MILQKMIPYPYLLLFSMVCMLACAGSGPRPILYGKDQCVYCKMTITDARFGTQLVTKKGRSYNFDDLSCMLAFVQSGPVSKQDIDRVYVPDYANDNKLYEAEKMFYLKSEDLKSPMRGDIAAFKSDADRQRVKSILGGIALNWQDIWKLDDENL